MKRKLILKKAAVCILAAALALGNMGTAASAAENETEEIVEEISEGSPSEETAASGETEEKAEEQGGQEDIVSDAAESEVPDEEEESEDLQEASLNDETEGTEADTDTEREEELVWEELDPYASSSSNEETIYNYSYFAA